MRHTVSFEDIQKLDSTVRYVVKFNGDRTISKWNHFSHFDASESVVFTLAPEYSFEKEEGTISNLLAKLAVGEMHSLTGF